MWKQRLFSLSCGLVNSTTVKRTLMSLTVGDKIQLIDELESGVKRKKDIASEFGNTAPALYRQY